MSSLICFIYFLMCSQVDQVIPVHAQVKDFTPVPNIQDTTKYEDYFSNDVCFSLSVQRMTKICFASLSLRQMAGYPGPHTLPSVPSALYPPQAAMVDTHHAHTHPRHHVHGHSHAQHHPLPHGQDMVVWASALDVRHISDI